MAEILSFPHAPSRTTVPSGAALVRQAGGLIDALVRRWRLRHDLQAVAALPDHMLADIGVSRGGAEDAVRHGRERVRAPAARALPAPSLPASFTEWR